MITAWQAAHFNAMHEARIRRSLRTITGRAYPVPEGQLLAWIRMQQEKKRKQALLNVSRPKLRARQRAEAAFA